MGLLRIPINNFFAFLTAFFALALAVEEVTWRRRILLRGAAFWSVVASLSGTYILGVHKINRVPFQYTLAPTLESVPLLLHLAAATLAVAIAVAAALYGSGWIRHALLAAAAMQAVTSVLMYFGALENTWGPWVPGYSPRGVRPPDGHGLGSCISEVPAR